MSNSGKIAVVIGAIIACLLQVVVAPNIAIAQALPNFMLAYVVVVSITMANTCGFVMPFVLGLIFDLIGGGPIGAMALLLVLVAFGLSRVFVVLDNDTLFITVILLIVSIFLVEIIHGLLVVACGTSVDLIGALVYRSLPCALYTCVFALIMYPLVVRFIARRDQRLDPPSLF